MGRREPPIPTCNEETGSCCLQAGTKCTALLEAYPAGKCPFKKKHSHDIATRGKRDFRGEKNQDCKMDDRSMRRYYNSSYGHRYYEKTKSTRTAAGTV